MRWNHKRNRWVAIGAAGLAACALAACSSSKPSSGGNGGSGGGGGDKSVSVDVGNGKTIKLKAPLNVGIYTSAASASFGQVEDAVIKSQGKKAGINITVFDSQFDSALQLKQLQSAIQTKKYNV